MTAAQVFALGSGRSQGRSTTSASGSRVSVDAVTCPAAVTRGGVPAKRRPKIPAQA